METKSKFYEIKYSFTSELENEEFDRFITSYKADIFELDERSDAQKLIGKLEFKIILLGLALNENVPYFEIFDQEQYTHDIGSQIFDFDTDELKESILDFYDYNYGTVGVDICILTRIEIHESHRRLGIGKKVIKDILDRFSSSCGLFVAQAFPLQFSVIRGELPEWSKQMNYDALDSDYEKAFYKLKAFYQKAGFNHIEGFNELMFLNPA